MAKQTGEAGWRARTDAAFPTIQDAERYLALLRESWTAVAARLGRQIALMYVLIVIFEVLAWSEDTAVTVGPLSLASPDPALIGLPIAVAALAYDVLQLVERYLDHARVHRALHEKHFPALRMHEFDRLIAPPLPSLLPFGIVLGRSNPTYRKLLQWTGRSVTVAGFLVPILFQGHAMQVLLDRFGADHWVPWAAGAIVCMIVVLTIVHMRFSGEEPD